MNYRSHDEIHTHFKIKLCIAIANKKHAIYIWWAGLNLSSVHFWRNFIYFFIFLEACDLMTDDDSLTQLLYLFITF